MNALVPQKIEITCDRELYRINDGRDDLPFRRHHLACLYKDPEYTETQIPTIPDMVSPGGASVGREWSRLSYLTFDAWVDEIAAEFGKNMGAVLDVGCASGFRAAAFVEKGCRVTGFDFEQRRAEIEERNALLVSNGFSAIHFKAGDVRLEGFNPATETYDMVHARLLLHFVQEEQLPDVIGKMARGLRPGGVLAAMQINDPAFSDDRLLYMDERRSSFLRDDPMSCGQTWNHRFSTLNRIAAQSGLLIEDVFVQARPDAGRGALAFVARKLPVPSL